MTQSYEVLANDSAHTTIMLGRKSGYTISPYGAFFLGILFLISLVITGLLVYYFSSCSSETSSVFGGSHLNFTTKKNLNVKLPKVVVPDLYEIWLIPFIWANNGNFTFHGQVMFYY